MIRRPPRSTLLTHSFPTRRSSDLDLSLNLYHRASGLGIQNGHPIWWPFSWVPDVRLSVLGAVLEKARHPFFLGKHTLRAIQNNAGKQQAHKRPRSEEHTSELQSLMRISYAVFCLKKKQRIILHTDTVNISTS